MSPHFFLFRFCIWRGFKNKSDICHVLCEEVFNLVGRPRIAKLMLKQSLVWNHWLCWCVNFSFDKITFSNFQISRDRERYLTGSVRDFTLCGILLERLFSCNSEIIRKVIFLFFFLLLERLFSCNSESITAAHVKDLQPWFVPRRNVTGFAVTLVVLYSETDNT